jgi:phospholipase C
VAEIYQNAGVDWRCYMNEYDYATNNGFNYFASFMNAPTNSTLRARGTDFSTENSLDAFYQDAANGTLPEVSWVFPPGSLQEHPPRTPMDGAWLMKSLVDAVINGPDYNSTVFIIMYDGKYAAA